MQDIFTGSRIKACRRDSKLSFGISDGKWLLEHVISLDEFPLSHAIHTNVKKLVDAKRTLFETVWRQSIPANEMFAKLEKSSPAEVNTHMDTDETENLTFQSYPEFQVSCRYDNSHMQLS